MNKWFQQSLLNNTQWVNELIAAGIKQALAGGSPYMQGLIDEIGEVYAEERRERRKDVAAAADESKRWFDGRVETKFLPRFEAFEQRLERCCARIDSLSQAIETERAERHKEIDLAFEAGQRGVETKLMKLETLEQRLTVASQVEQQADSSNDQRLTAIDQRVERLERETEGRLGPGALHESQCAVESKIEAKLTALEERLKSTPGKLPVARSWKPETVVYQAEFVSHDGALWQAKKDTATTPGGDDWVCVACAGRDGTDGLSPNVCGTFDARKTYQELDIVALDGGMFIAKYDNPGACPGNGWQLAAKQGRTGKPGARGPRGDEGDKAEPVTIISWQIDRSRYRASPLWSDGQVGPNLELRGLYEQFHEETGGYEG
jgi:hypothetical protein